MLVVVVQSYGHHSSRYHDIEKIANTIITIHVYGTVKPVSSGHGILATTDRWLVVLFRINVTGTSNMTKRESYAEHNMGIVASQKHLSIMLE